MIVHTELLCGIYDYSHTKERKGRDNLFHDVRKRLSASRNEEKKLYLFHEIKKRRKEKDIHD